MLAVSSTGGHLDELLAVAPRFTVHGQRLVWVTAASAQSESLLRGQDVEWVRQIGSRQLGRVLASLPQAMQVIQRHQPQKVVSTGAALGVPYLLAASIQGIETHYVESATRLDGPSVTGRIAEVLPGAALYRQSTRWRPRARSWRDTDSVFSAFQWRSRRVTGSLSVLVILGTERFDFSRAVHAVTAAAPPDANIVWQLGHTPPPAGLPGKVRPWFSFEELQQEAGVADVVVTHCGVGSVLMALRSGKCPVVIARESARREHVDDHQTQLANVLGESGLAIVPDPTLQNLATAMAMSAERQAIARQAHVVSGDNPGTSTTGSANASPAD